MILFPVLRSRSDPSPIFSLFAPPLQHTQFSAMDAIKKKMQAMKLEKDNAMDRADACEQQAKDANLRAERVSFMSHQVIIEVVEYKTSKSCQHFTKRDCEG